MSDGAIGLLYIVGGATIIGYALLGIVRPEKFWGTSWSRSLHFTSEEGTRPLKRAASALALLGGIVLVTKGFALI